MEAYLIKNPDATIKASQYLLRNDRDLYWVHVLAARNNVNLGVSTYSKIDATKATLESEVFDKADTLASQLSKLEQVTPESLAKEVSRLGKTSSDSTAPDITVDGMYVWIRRSTDKHSFSVRFDFASALAIAAGGIVTYKVIDKTFSNDD